MCEEATGAGGGGAGGGGRDAEPKTRTPHKDVGKIYIKIRGNHDTYEEIMEHQQKLTGM